jgi:hypothetical protein
MKLLLIAAANATVAPSVATTIPGKIEELFFNPEAQTNTSSVAAATSPETKISRAFALTSVGIFDRQNMEIR